MKFLYSFTVTFLFTFLSYSQNYQNPLIILDAKEIGYMKDVAKQLEPINPNEISTVTVYKDSVIAKKYGSAFGVIIITTKKYILDTFYKNNIENSPLKTDIPSPEYLLKIEILNKNPESKNQPYDEFQKYIYTNTINDKIKKISSITFIKPIDSEKINSEWKYGALEIKNEEEY